MKKNFISTKSSQAFTLIELLVVITIIAILAGIALPVFTSMQAKGDQVSCLNNLRQIGVAMGSYISDNNGTLPGPINNGQPIYYANTTSPTPPNPLAYFLYPYISGNPFPTASSAIQNLSSTVAPLFVCPSWARVVCRYSGGGSVKNITYPASTDNVICYVESGSIPNGSSLTPVFGVAAQGALPGSPPKPLALVAELVGNATTTSGTTSSSATPNFSLSQSIMLTDCDQVNWAFDSTATWYSTLPKTPVHRGGRNSLFWDFHAESRPLTSIP